MYYSLLWGVKPLLYCIPFYIPLRDRQSVPIFYLKIAYFFCKACHTFLRPSIDNPFRILTITMRWRYAV